MVNFNKEIIMFNNSILEEKLIKYRLVWLNWHLNMQKIQLKLYIFMVQTSAIVCFLTHFSKMMELLLKNIN